MKKPFGFILMAALLLAVSCGPKEQPSIATKPPATIPQPTQPPTVTEPVSQTPVESSSEEIPTETESTVSPEINPEGRMMDSPGLDIDSEAYCVIDDELQIVTGKNEFRLMAPASITKIMTCLITAEMADMNGILEVSERAVDQVGIISSGVYPSLKPGERFTVEEMLYMLMVPSTNAAGNVLAEHVAGSIEAFVSMMNAKVASLGLTHTHFMNPHGFDEANHYSCAFDMAVIMRAAYQNEALRPIMKAFQYTAPATEYTPAREMTTGNPLLTGAVNCPGLLVAKNGATPDAGATMAAACERNGITLYCCTMKAESGANSYDTANLFNAAFAFLSGKSPASYGFLHHIRFYSADEESILIRAAAMNNVSSIKAVYWKESEGTGTAKTIEGIHPSDDIGILLPMEDREIGTYIFQLFVTDANGHESVYARSLLYTQHDPVKGRQQWYEYTIYVDEDGFTPNGVMETKDGAYFMNRGEYCYGFVGAYYFAGEDGRIVTGWFESSSTRYYSGADGRVVTGKRIIGGQLYTFNEYGALEE